MDWYKYLLINNKEIDFHLTIKCTHLILIIPERNVFLYYIYVYVSREKYSNNWNKNMY